MKHLERDLEQLQRHILALSARVEEIIDKAGRALRERRMDLADEVLGADDEVDRNEVQIEEECLKILALHQPVARDLRRTGSWGRQCNPTSSSISLRTMARYPRTSLLR